MTAKRVGVALLGVALAAGTLSAAAQEPAGPPPPSSRVEDQGTAVLELLPALGRIGAQAGLLVGFSRNPYGVGSGVQAAGYLDGPLLGGLVSQAPELQALGIPTGQGDVEAGFHAGGGVELRLAKGLSLNLDYRLTGVGGASHRLHAFSSGLGIHW